jgi:O-antigen ligase
MEIAVCLGLGLVLGGGMQFYERLGGGAMVVLGTVGVVMSRSRGGGMTLIVILVAAAIWGLTHLPREARWWWRLSACAFVLMLILLLANLAEPYMTRFGSYFGWQQFRGRPASEAFDAMQKRTMGHSRPHMFVAAYRAWKTAPWLGIGPGMHDALWPHFAPSADGDRATGKWPTYLNNSHTSNEVHNDWLELLEEYGLVGFALFLLPFSLLIRDYHRGLKQDARRARIREIMYEDDSDPWKDAVVLGVFLAILAMSFHSLGDFNLQIPATTWIMATLVGLGLSAMWQAPSPGQAS